MSRYTKSSTLWKERPHQSILGKALFVLPLFLLAMALSFCVDASVSEARDVDISVAEERRIAQSRIMSLKNDPNVTAIKTNPDLTRIQKEIVNANPNVLWFEDGRHDYFLRPIQEITYRDDTGASFNIGDGYIFISTTDLRYINGIYPMMSARRNNPWNIYNNSELASTIAHEIGHWKNTEKHDRTVEERLSQENNADLSALELTEGTSFYGYGGELITWYRQTQTITEKVKNDKTHASPQARFKVASDYVSRASNGRIKIDIKGNCTYDGKPIFLANKSKQVPVPFGDSPVIDVIQEERTMYVAGQIAFAIKYGVWNTDNLIVTSHDDAFGTKGWNYIVLAVKNPKSGGIKVIDKFLITPERFRVIYKAFLGNDATTLNTLNEEETYFLQLMYYIHTNSK